MRSSTSGVSWSRLRGLRWLCSVALLLAPVVTAQRSDEDFQLALGLIQRGLHGEAARSLEKFLRQQPRHELAAEAWYRLGACQSEAEDRDAAITSWRKALQLGNFALQTECRYRLGHALRDSGQHEAAAQLFGQLIEAADDGHYLVAPACYAAGECWRDLGKSDAALRCFEAAAETGGDEYGLPALYQAGFVLLRLERPADAGERFGKAADDYPKHAAANECRYLQGDAAFRARRFDVAEGAFEQARRAGGEFADDAAMGLAWCAVERGDTAAALKAFRRVVADFAKGPLARSARLEAGRLLHRAEQHEQAIAELAPLLDGTAGSDDERALQCSALELTGLSLLHSGKADAALVSLQRAASFAAAGEDAARLAYGLGEAHAELQQWPEAAAAYRNCQAQSKTADLLGDARYGECLALHKAGEFEPSLRVAHAFVQEHREHRLAVHARFAAGENLFALKRYADADAAYAEIPRDHELGTRAAFKRAWSTYMLSDRAVAAKRFRELVPSERSDDPLVEEALSMAALAFMEAQDLDAAMAAADLYKVRYAEGRFLARTERVASRVLRERGDLPGAAKRLAAAAGRASSDTEAAEDRLEQAELLFRQGDFSGATKLYEALAARDDASGARALEGMAWCAFELADDTACLRDLQRALQHPAAAADGAGLLELQFAVHQRAERWSEAAAAATRFLSKFAAHARTPNLRFGLGLAQARAGQHAAAHQTLAALAASGGYERMDRVHYELAWACRRDGDEAAAVAAFEQVARESKDVDLAGEARLHVGVAALAKTGAGAGEREAARALLGQVRGKHRGRALYRVGFSWLDEKQPKRAMPAFVEMIALADAGELGDEELIVEARFLAGECAFELEDFAVAATHYRALLAADNEHARVPAAQLHLGRCAVALSQPQEAINVLEAFLARGDKESGPDRARANLWSGQARLQVHQHEAAEAALQSVTRLSDGELGAEAQFWIGEVRKDKGDLDGAVDAYVKLSILYGQEAWVQRGLFEAAHCYEKLEQPQKAKKFFGELVERFPDAELTKEARTALQRLRQP